MSYNLQIQTYGFVEEERGNKKDESKGKRHQVSMKVTDSCHLGPRDDDDLAERSSEHP